MPRKSVQETVRMGKKDPLYAEGIQIGRDATRLGVTAASEKYGCSDHTTRYWRRVFDHGQKRKTTPAIKSKAIAKSDKVEQKLIGITIPGIVIEQLRQHKKQIASLQQAVERQDRQFLQILSGRAQKETRARRKA